MGSRARDAPSFGCKKKCPGSRSGHREMFLSIPAGVTLASGDVFSLSRCAARDVPARGLRVVGSTLHDGVVMLARVGRTNRKTRLRSSRPTSPPQVPRPASCSRQTERQPAACRANPLRPCPPPHSKTSGPRRRPGPASDPSPRPESTSAGALQRNQASPDQTLRRKVLTASAIPSPIAGGARPVRQPHCTTLRTAHGDRRRDQVEARHCRQYRAAAQGMGHPRLGRTGLLVGTCTQAHRPRTR